MNRTEHLLTIGMEECAEVAQRISKALRFGLFQVQQDPDDEPQQNPLRLDNRERIRLELGDLLGVLAMARIIDLKYIIDQDLYWQARNKQDKVNRYLLRSANCQTLTPDVQCEHGRAMDIHCCECKRSGFLFDINQCSCDFDIDNGVARPGASADTRLGIDGQPSTMIGSPSIAHLSLVQLGGRLYGRFTRRLTSAIRCGPGRTRGSSPRPLG